MARKLGTVSRSVGLIASGVIVATGLFDAGCTKDQACKPEILVCENDATKIVACFDKCVPRGKANDPCSFDPCQATASIGVCNPGLSCVPARGSTTVGVCFDASLGPSAACNTGITPDICTTGTYCRAHAPCGLGGNDLCATYAVVGAACDADYSATVGCKRCEPGAYCSDHVCTRGCFKDDDCACGPSLQVGYQCINNRCKTVSEIFSPCSGPQDPPCASGLVCEAAAGTCCKPPGSTCFGGGLNPCCGSVSSPSGGSCVPEPDGQSRCHLNQCAPGLSCFNPTSCLVGITTCDQYNQQKCGADGTFPGGTCNPCEGHGAFKPTVLEGTKSCDGGGIHCNLTDGGRVMGILGDSKFYGDTCFQGCKTPDANGKQHPTSTAAIPTMRPKAPCGLCAGEACVGGNGAVCAPGLACSGGTCKASSCTAPFTCYTPADLYNTGNPDLVGCP